MKVLIIEDNYNKLDQIESFLVKTVQNIIIDKGNSYNSGIRKIYDAEYDLIVLDMSLPTFDVTPRDSGGIKRAVAGREILQRMEHKEIFTPVVIMTQFEKFGEDQMSLADLNKELENEFKNTWKATIHYDAGKQNWKNELEYWINVINKEKRND